MLYFKFGGLTVIALALLILVALTIGETIAYLTTESDPVSNTFTASTSGITVNEEFDNAVKKNVNVTNNSSYPVYVRATYVAYWVSDTDGSVLPEIAGVQGTINGSKKWVLKDDGYYYYNEILAPNATTENLIDEIIAVPAVKPNGDTYDGYTYVVDVIAESVQAEPQQAVLDVWGFVPTTVSVDVTQ